MVQYAEMMGNVGVEIARIVINNVKNYGDERREGRRKCASSRIQKEPSTRIVECKVMEVIIHVSWRIPNVAHYIVILDP